MLNSDLLVKDSVVSGLNLLSVLDSVLVGVASLWLVSVSSDGVGSLEDFNLSSVSVLDLLLVKDLVVSLVAHEWDISPEGLSVVAVDLSWLPGVSGVHVWSVLDLVLGGVPDLLSRSVLGLLVEADVGDWNLSGSDLSLLSRENLVLDFVVVDEDVSESSFLTVLDVSVLVFVWLVAIGGSLDSGNETSDVFHGWRDLLNDTVSN